MVLLNAVNSSMPMSSPDPRLGRDGMMMRTCAPPARPPLVAVWELGPASGTVGPGGSPEHLRGPGEARGPRGRGVGAQPGSRDWHELCNCPGLSSSSENRGL